MFVIQDEVISTGSYLKYIIRDPNAMTNAHCPHGSSLETIQYVTDSYPKLAQIMLKKST